MKVVIDIPKKLYYDIKESYSIQLGEHYSKQLIHAVRNGELVLSNYASIDADESVVAENKKTRCRRRSYISNFRH